MLDRLFRRFLPSKDPKPKQESALPAGWEAVGEKPAPSKAPQTNFELPSVDVPLPPPPPMPTPPPASGGLASFVKGAAKQPVVDNPGGTIPAELRVTSKLRFLPANMPDRPKAWTVGVIRRDKDSFWIQRAPGENDPLPAKPGEMATLVMFNDQHHNTYECKILKVVAGNPEQVQMAPPSEVRQEESRSSGIGNRKHFRLEIRLPVDLKFDGQSLLAYTRDISLGGIAIDLTRAVPEGTLANIEVRTWNFPLKTTVKVVRCFEVDGAYIAALAFPPDMSTIARDLVSHFLSEHRR